MQWLLFPMGKSHALSCIVVEILDETDLIIKCLSVYWNKFVQLGAICCLLIR